MPRMQFLRRDSSIKESPRFENSFVPSYFPPKIEPKEEETIIQQDSGDLWVKNQEVMYDKKEFNWNNEVEGLLDSEDELQLPENQKPKKARAAKPAQTPNVNIRRHRKKSKKQLEVLNSYFNMDEEWTLDLVEKLATDLNLEKDQVYKWNWDKRKRLRKKAEKQQKASALKNKNKE